MKYISVNHAEQDVQTPFKFSNNTKYGGYIPLTNWS